MLATSAAMRQRGNTQLPVGLKDVAREAGVSIKTVSNVVNGYVHVRAETRDRVTAALPSQRGADRSVDLFVTFWVLFADVQPRPAGLIPGIKDMSRQDLRELGLAAHPVVGRRVRHPLFEDRGAELVERLDHL